MCSEAIEKLKQAAAAGHVTSETPANVADWLSKDCVAEYHDAILQLIASEDWSRLDELFWTTIPFGTGGRRGPMGEMGPASINDRTIAESAHGLACYLRESGVSEGGAAAVTCDTRNRSMHFARLTATTLAAHGIKVFLFESHRATPELSYAVRELNCNIGVMISASHNPPADNGFKAYWSNGAQVIPPHDAGIMNRSRERPKTIPTVDYDDAVAVRRKYERRWKLSTGRSHTFDEVAALSQSTSNRDISADLHAAAWRW